MPALDSAVLRVSQLFSGLTSTQSEPRKNAISVLPEVIENRRVLVLSKIRSVPQFPSCSDRGAVLLFEQPTQPESASNRLS